MHKPLVTLGVVAVLASLSLGAVAGITVRLVAAVLSPAGNGAWIPLLLVAILVAISMPSLVTDRRSHPR